MIVDNDCIFLCYIFSELAEVGHGSKDSGVQLFAGTDEKPAIVFPPVVTAQWEEQVIFIYMILVIWPELHMLSHHY